MPPPTTTTATPNIHPTSNITAAAAAAAVPTPAAAATTAHEKMWHEMQQKLEEVSLSGDHVFGSTHSKSLASLRTAQVELAQAWMRSEEDDLDNKHTVFGHQAFAPAASGAGGGAAASSSAAAVQEQDEDLLLAGERRRANDAHFARVAMSVVDVTRRLENVARAMAGVELESRGIWAGSSDSDGSSLLS
ncbi:hypothetical protein DFP73DRAFT_486988 [Morchella snyderi]|nr:hypothetical protein DFP73DRAFT_486988 [Morchella snyderi]